MRLAIAALALALAAPAAAAPQTIVLIVADDLREQDRAYLPALEELAARGATFAAAMTPFPLCTPARTSLLTGWHPRRHGIYGNRESGEFSDAWPTLGTRLQEQGYRTGFIGKRLNRDDGRSWPGWNLERIVRRHNEHGSEQSRVIAQQAVDFLRSCDGGRCFLYLAPIAPHGPLRGPSPECDGAGEVAPDGVDAKRWNQRQSALCGLDLLLRDVLGALPDDALVIFTSDNGFAMGENDRHGKNQAIWDAVQVPLIIAAPGVVVAERREMVMHMDVHATILDVAGSPRDDDGTPLTGLLYDPEAARQRWTPTILIESASPDEEEVLQ